MALYLNIVFSKFLPNSFVLVLHNAKSSLTVGTSGTNYDKIA